MQTTKMESIKIDDILKICENLDQFKFFIDDLNKFLTKCKNKEKTLKKICNINKSLFKSKYKNFYIKNKEIIDQLNKDGQFEKFIKNIISNGDIKPEINELYFYLVKNKNNLQSIVKTLNKLKTLTFKEIFFSVEFKFSIHCELRKKHQQVLTYFDQISKISDNTYNGTGSHYMIKIEHNLKNGTLDHAYIYLNSLIFSEEILPKTIEYEYILKLIIEKINLINDNKPSEIDLIKAFISTMFPEILAAKDIEEIKKLLTQIQQLIAPDQQKQKEPPKAYQKTIHQKK